MKNPPEFFQGQFFSRAYHLILLLVLAFLLFYGLKSSLHYRQQVIASIDPAAAGNDMVSVWDRRMRKLIPYLPDHGVVGYLADRDVKEYPYGYNDQMIEFILSQYSLAPLTLQRGEDFPVIIGNFSDTGDPEKLPFILQKFNVTITREHTNEIFILSGNNP